MNFKYLHTYAHIDVFKYLHDIYRKFEHAETHKMHIPRRDASQGERIARSIIKFLVIRQMTQNRSYMHSSVVLLSIRTSNVN